MDYDNIPQHISHFISRAVYTRALPEIREILIESATETFNINSDNVKFRAEMTTHPTPRDMFVPGYTHEVAGIRRIQYILAEGHEAPDRSQFVAIIQALVKEMHAINVVLHYIGQNDDARCISFAQVDIRRTCLEGLYQVLKQMHLNGTLICTMVQNSL